MDRNRLTNLPKDLFGSLRSLQLLSLSFNLLNLIDEHIFDGLDRSYELKLYGNKVTQVSNLPLQNLLICFLNNNEISSLGHIFNSTIYLETIDLRDTNLIILKSGIFRTLGNLKHLYLSFNQLISLSHGVLTDLVDY